MAFLPTKQRASMGFSILLICQHCWYIVSATVKPIRDENGYIYGYREAIGEYPRWGEDDPRSNNWQNGWSKLTTRLRSHELYKTSYSITFEQSHLTLLTASKLVTHQFTRCHTLTKMVLWTCLNWIPLTRCNPSNKAKKVDGCKTGLLSSLDFSYAADEYLIGYKYHLNALGKTRDEQVDNGNKPWWLLQKQWTTRKQTLWTWTMFTKIMSGRGIYVHSLDTV